MLRLRTLAAAALLFAGIILGFALGRMSVWLVGFDAPGHDTVAREATQRGTSGAGRPTPRPPAPVAAPEPKASQPTVAVPASPSSPQPATPESQSARAAEPAPNAAAVTQEPPKPVVAPNWRAAAGDPANAPNANAEDRGAGPNVKVINPGQDDAARVAAQPARDAEFGATENETDRQGIAACERRYSSFRRSDGTYQPYGGGPRQRCPLLR